MRWDPRARWCRRRTRRPPTMVTLITEKLQNQSLDDLAHQSCDAGPCSAEKRNSRSGPVFPFETNGDRCPWKALSGGWPLGSLAAVVPALPFPPGLGAGSAVGLRESAGPALAPPSKRHCRSLSEPDELARCRSPWRPGGSKVWTAVSKRRCHSGGSASLPGGALPAAGPGSPPAPRPASASGGCEDASCPPRAPPGPALCSRRRLSLSQEHLLDTDAPAPAPAPGWRLGLLRSRSQPCVLAGRKSRRKRPREEDPRWPRPSLDFLKMTRTLKNSKSLGSLDCDGEDEDEARAKTAVPSPRAPHGLAGLASPASSPLGARRSPWAGREGRGAGAPGAWDRAGQEVCPPGPGELDLEQIENN
ncbi:protein FAM53A isoform X2 [Pipistrellus kuhlii]|nr:protein FAM53A [Pipistrellus kuhlii]XP_045429985.1 protein FAM53A isoform X2 [Pipistrellus kuhlii]XP_045429986.1 protein FAM53A isoform X2 [Pipistrellus kuhlii]